MTEKPPRIPPIWYTEVLEKEERQGGQYRVTVNTPHLPDPDPTGDGRCLYCGMAWNLHPAVVRSWANRVLNGFRVPGRLRVRDPKIADRRYESQARAKEASFEFTPAQAERAEATKTPYPDDIQEDA